MVYFSTMKDKIYQKKLQKIPKFRFNKEVADVFDDMIHRSIPFYKEVQTMMTRLSLPFITEHPIYDLGCSTGTTLHNLCKAVTDKPLHIIGIDQSQDMIEKTKDRLSTYTQTHTIELLNHDLNTDITLKPCNLVYLTLTLQFLNPDRKTPLLQTIFDALHPTGALLLVEKIKGESPTTNNLFIDLYHHYKKESGYTALEIEQKKEALEKVLIPDTLSYHQETLKTIGFSTIEPFFKWFNFVGLLAIK
ncbi:carboxy-S-adenosyl-L-methionine synthase CmoA [Candidatus Marinamargulisbacteria bacterium SCGC AG-439-L15]|nr:carboxy-S-adenosyl-L-methionine synthase CmoA [Candidatus Marinamargulisbacteria bacterium SCGC AG-439-L15]